MKLFKDTILAIRQTINIAANAMVIVITSIIATTSYAHDQSCLVEDRVLLKTQKNYLTKCEVKVSPTIKTTERTYPKLNNNPYTVRYWDAILIKPIFIHESYTRYVTNRCTNEVVYTGPFDSITKLEVPFVLDNPNFDPQITETFRLAPMTDIEAQAAFQKLQANCNSYHD